MNFHSFNELLFVALTEINVFILSVWQTPQLQRQTSQKTESPKTPASTPATPTTSKTSSVCIMCIDWYFAFAFASWSNLLLFCLQSTKKVERKSSTSESSSRKSSIDDTPKEKDKERDKDKGEPIRLTVSKSLQVWGNSHEPFFILTLIKKGNNGIIL